MKSLKLTIALLLFISFSSTIIAQEVVTKKIKKSKHRAKQISDDSFCSFYNSIYKNVHNGFIDIQGKKTETDLIANRWKTTIAVPDFFVDHYVNSSKGVFTTVIYDDFDKNSALEKFDQIHQSILDCAKNNHKKIVFIKDDNKLNQKQGRRNILLTTQTDDILINIKLFSSSYKMDKNNKLKKAFYVAVSFKHLKNKQKSIKRFLNM